MENIEITPGSIVVGVDGSEHADLALDWAVDQAVLERRPLAVVHGARWEATWMMDEAGIDHRAFYDGMQANAAFIVSSAGERARQRAPGLDVEEVLRIDDARQTLIELSPRAALIVLGSRGRGPVKSLLLGSVSAAVARHAECPVVVLRPQKAGIVRRGVLVGVDDSEHARTSLEFAYREASLRNLPLTVMHCFWDARSATMGAGLLSESEEGYDEVRLLVAEAVSGMAEKFPDVPVSIQLARGLVDDCLVRAAFDMDMVVVGSHHRNPVAGLLHGSTAAAVLEHAECIVAVVPESLQADQPLT